MMADTRRRKYFPYEAFDFETSSTKEEMIKKLKAKIHEKRYRWFSNDVGFEGEVFGDGFKISRITSGCKDPQLSTS